MMMHFDLKTFTSVVSRHGVRQVMLAGALWPIHPASRLVRCFWSYFELLFWKLELARLHQSQRAQRAMVELFAGSMRDKLPSSEEYATIKHEDEGDDA